MGIDLQNRADCPACNEKSHRDKGGYFCNNESCWYFRVKVMHLEVWNKLAALVKACLKHETIKEIQ